MIADIPKVKIEFAEHNTELDLDDPVLPEEIHKRSLSAGGYPYEKKLKRKVYEHALEKLQIELVKVQNSLSETGERVVIVFEGRDTAGKGGTIERFRMNLSHRRAKTVALSKPTETERGQWYFQRYTVHMPTDGEIILFDRSWYNRAGVEPVMGFCTPEQHRQFLQEAPDFEKMLINDGIHLFKFWLNIGQETQIKRFHDRRHSPLKSWKLSPLDIKAMEKWQEYTTARDQMLEATHTPHAPWTLVRSNDKKRARLNAIRHFLINMEYKSKDLEAIGELDPKIVGSGPSFLNEFGE